jgi:hypothetical protein
LSHTYYYFFFGVGSALPNYALNQVDKSKSFCSTSVEVSMYYLVDIVWISLVMLWLNWFDYA